MAVGTLDTEGKWMVNNSHIYVPASPCKVEHSNVTAASTGRDETGVMHIDWLRRDVRKVFLKYGALSASELAYMINLMQGQEFTFTFFDQGTTKTFNGYVGESTYELYSYADGEPIYTDVEIHVIEM